MLKFFKKNKLVVRIAAAVLFVGGLVMFLLSSCTPAGKTYSFTEDGYTVEYVFDADKSFEMYTVYDGERNAFYPDTIKVKWRIEKGMVQVGVDDWTDFGKCVGPSIVTELRGERITMKSAANTAVFIVGIVLGVVGLAAEGVLCYSLYVKKD